MRNGSKHHGVVVPMVTPVTPTGELDEPAVERLVEFLIAGEVDGIFVLGTTGEGTHAPRQFRKQTVAKVAAQVRHRVTVYAGIGDTGAEAIGVGNECLDAGADAVVAYPPASLSQDELLPWFQNLLAGLNGPLVIYNMPQLNKLSIPVEMVAAMIGHPKLAGIKDSENNPQRLASLLAQCGGKPGFAVFVGVGALMERGLKLGANGIVPSVGNLVPETCHKLWTAAQHGDWAEAETQAARMNSVAAVYQTGRTLGQSLSALKAALHCRGFCAPHVRAPLRQLSEAQVEELRLQMAKLNLLN